LFVLFVFFFHPTKIDFFLQMSRGNFFSRHSQPQKKNSKDLRGPFATLFCSGLHIISTFLSTTDKVGAATVCKAWSAQSAPFWNHTLTKLGALPQLARSALRHHIGAIKTFDRVTLEQVSMMHRLDRLHTLKMHISLSSVHNPPFVGAVSANLAVPVHQFPIPARKARRSTNSLLGIAPHNKS